MTGELIKLLLYFDVFSYPLTKKEIIDYSGLADESILEVGPALESLKKRGVIGYYRGFYYIGNQRSKVTRRVEGNRRAVSRMHAARKYSRIISCFPFIRGVFLSGSISKGYMSEKDDIDYFILTEPGRLWLVRTMLTLYKKLFLLNSRRNFCINYFIDTDHLFIREHNRFTATEIVFLIPGYNLKLYNDFLQRNSWVKAWYPNFTQKYKFCHEKDPVFKRLLEKIFDNSLGNKLEMYFYRISRSFIRRKFSHLDQECFSGNFRILDHELRYFPGRKQPEIMKMYHEKVAEFGWISEISCNSDIRKPFSPGIIIECQK